MNIHKAMEIYISSFLKDFIYSTGNKFECFLEKADIVHVMIHLDLFRVDTGSDISFATSLSPLNFFDASTTS